MQMKSMTTCESFITLLQERFAVFFNCATSGTKECRRPFSRESLFRFAGGHFRRYNLFGTELFQLSPLVFSSGHFCRHRRRLVFPLFFSHVTRTDIFGAPVDYDS